MDTAVRFPVAPRAVKATALTLSKRMSVERAFQAIARNCIEQIQANEAGVVRAGDPEFLHQMRIGLRRLDAAFTQFAAVLRAPPVIAQELAWLMDQLGPARDWDVFLGATLPKAAGALAPRPALDSVKEAAHKKSGQLHAQASAAVASDRFARLFGVLEKWVAQRGWRDDITARDKARLKSDVAGFADAILEREQQRLLKRGRKLKDADPRRRHRARIAAKRTRYAAEAFASLYPARRLSPYVKALAAVQDRLGELNDAAVAARLLDALCDGDATLREGAALVCGYLAASSKQGVRRVRKQWKKFTPLAPPS